MYLDSGGRFLGCSLVVGLIFSIAASGQSVPEDGRFVSAAAKNVGDIYLHALAVESHLYNGILYKEYNPHSNDEGNPFFLSDDWTDGSVYYDGERYDNVPLLYDLVKERLVVEHAYGGVKLELISEKINNFSMAGHTFVRLVSDTSTSSLRTGFYD